MLQNIANDVIQKSVTTAVAKATEKTVDTVSYTVNGEVAEIVNTELIQHTRRIQALKAVGNSATKLVCKELASVSADGSYKGNFKSVAEYGSALFDFSKSTVSTYIQIAENFLTADAESVTGKYTIGQLQEFLPIVKNPVAGETPIQTIQRMEKEGRIGSGYTTKELRDRIKSGLALTDNAADNAESEPKLSDYCKVLASKKATFSDKVSAYAHMVQLAYGMIPKDSKDSTDTDAIKFMEIAEGFAVEATGFIQNR